jgi:hypothetical protein
MELLQDFYETTLDALKDAKNRKDVRLQLLMLKKFDDYLCN